VKLATLSHEPIVAAGLSGMSAAPAQAPPAPLRSSGPIRVRIFHQIDPAGAVSGGIDTFIRGLIKAAPPDIQISIVGLTTDSEQRPVGRWTSLDLPGGRIDFFPVAHNRNPAGRSRLPLSLKLTVGISRHFRACASGCDILEFHRFEPAIPFLGDSRPKTAFIHQDMAVIHNPSSDIRWKGMPGLYFALERRVIPRFASLFGVRASAVDAYRLKYPEIADRFRFISTWMDPEVFYPTAGARKDEVRRSLWDAFGLTSGDEVLLSVGRLDQQKNPLLLLDSFALVNRTRPNTRLIVVGDGVLRPALASRAKALGLDGKVIFAGLRSPGEVSDLLQLADGFLLTSAYEGMPMSVLEALGCGVPVVTTRVGEVERVVHDRVNGQVVDEHSPEAFAGAVLELLSNRGACRGQPCTEAVEDYVPGKVLAPVYENYRVLACHDAPPSQQFWGLHRPRGLSA
jgi:glycosyltransferase involved in cell wall biosynthesis